MHSPDGYSGSFFLPMKVLLVCLGNICRSPMAEGIMRHQFEKHGVSGEVDSAGTGSWHEGERPDDRAIQTAANRGIDISMQRARQIRKHDLMHFDKIFVADAEVLKGVLELAKTEDEKRKVLLLMENSRPGTSTPVPDPYFGSMNDFNHAFDLIEEACIAFCFDVKKNY